MDAAPHDPLAGLAAQSAGAVELLRLLAVMAADSVPISLFVDHTEPLPKDLAAILIKPKRRDGCLRSLEEAGLIETGDEALLLPEPVGEALRALDSDGLPHWCAIGQRLLRDAFPDEPGDYLTWEECEALLPHLRSVTGHAEGLKLRNDSWSWLLDRAAVYLHSRGEFGAALELSTRAVEGTDATEDEALLGTLHLTLGELRSEHGEGEEARAEIEEALEIHRPLGDEDIHVRWDRVALAEVLCEAGEREAALEQLDLALANRGSKGTDRCDLAARRMLGWVHWEDGELEEARVAYEAALELAEKTLGPEHQDVANTRTGLGGVLGGLGRLDEARDQLEKALDFTVTTLGERHPEVAVIRSNLSGVMQSLGELEGARAQLDLALDAGEESLPRDHRGIWIRHRKLATVQLSLGRLEAARAHGEEALAISRRTVDPHSERIEGDLQVLASVQQALGDRTAALGSYREAMSIAAQARGEDHLDVADYNLRLGQICRELGKGAEGREHLQRALAVFEKAPETSARASLARLELAQLAADLAEQLAGATESLGRVDQSGRIMEEVGTAFREALETELEEADAALMTSIAEAAIEREPDLARSVLEDAEKALEEAGEAAAGTPRRNLGAAWHRLGRVLMERKDQEGAVRALEAALLLLDGHLQFQGIVLHDIATVRSAQGNTEAAIRFYRQAAERKREAGEKGNRRDLAITLLALGRALARQPSGDGYAEALAVYDEQLETLRSLPEREPRLEGMALHESANLWRKKRETEKAIALFRKALERKREAGTAAGPLELGLTLTSLGRTLNEIGRYEEAAECHREWLAALRADPELAPESEGVALHDIANARRSAGNVEEAIELYREAVERKREGSDLRDLAISVQALGRCFEQLRDYPTALEHYNEQLRLLRSLPRRDYHFEGVALHDIADVHMAQGESGKAIELYEEAVEEKRRGIDTADPRSLIATQQALGRALEQSEDLPAALAAYREQLSMLHELPQRDPQVEGVALHDIANVKVAEGQLEKAAELYREALERKQAAEPISAGSLSTTQQALGRALEQMEDYPAAETAYRESLETLRTLSQPDVRAEAINVHDIADVKRALGESEQAVELYREAANLSLSWTGGDDRRGAAISLQRLGRTLAENDDPEGALEAYREQLDILRSLPDSDRDGRLEGTALRHMADALALQGEAEEAIRFYREAAERIDEAADVKPEEKAAVLVAEASLEFRLGRNAEANEASQAALELLRAAPDPDPALLYATLSICGTVASRTDSEQALEYLGEAARALDARASVDPLERAAVRTLLGRSYEQLGRIEEADAARAEAVAIFEQAMAGGLEPDGDTLLALCGLGAEHENEDLIRAGIAYARRLIEEEQSPDRLGMALVYLLGMHGRLIKVRHQDLDAALRAYDEQLETLRSLPVDDPQLEGVCLHDVADVKREQGQLGEAIGLYEQALERKHLAGEAVDRDDLATTLLALGSSRSKAGDVDGAALSAGDALEILRDEDDPDSDLLVTALSLVAAGAAADGDPRRALDLLREAERHFEDPPVSYGLDPAWILELRAEVHEQLGEAAEAESARARAGTLSRG